MDEDHPHIFSIKDALEEQMYGKEGVAKRRRAAELEHERELAQIRRARFLKNDSRTQSVLTGAQFKTLNAHFRHHPTVRIH